MEADWLTVKLDYISGNEGYRALAKKHGVSFSTLQKKAKLENWPALRMKAERDADATVVELASADRVSRAVRIENLADLLLDKIELTLNGIDGRKSNKACKDLSDALRNAKDILGVRTEKDMEEQDARIAKLRQDCGQDKHEPVVVVMGGEAESYGN